ncbi:hypothetical protein K435DRAFT_838531 [Dendrothele bispora CBS 962.96]|uniref:Citrate transporter-like domain-containing protein n=1 Tax=Dendrothele bispora (strain CBS 962.96) TaxID=1314807 RepID=A0A4S8M5W7_DENBC|nr:hypothetical protein K435DRAFT_838531 [Dendrothele bispora CBS 962.96]
MITRFSIVTLVFFILSIAVVIYPVSIPLPRLPYLGKRRVPINLTTAPILTIAILWAAQCLGPTQIRDGIVGTDGVKPYNILILFFSLAYMAITLDVTGILQSAAFWVSNKGGSNGWKLYFYFYVMLTVLSVVLGNDPVILSGTVFLVYYTSATRLEPMPWIISEFAAANTASMVLFLGNPTNVVVCEGFSINNVAFTAYTILPFLACNIVCFGALAFQFRGRKHIPKRLEHVGYLDPKSVLRDPVSAGVGSFLLGSTLIVIIIVSFFNVDVWMITLPFAVAKFIFDLCWDHYRYTHDMIPQYTSKAQDIGDGASDSDSGDTEKNDAMLAAIQRAMTSNSIEAQPERRDTLGSMNHLMNTNRTNTLMSETGLQPSQTPTAIGPELTAEKRSPSGSPDSGTKESNTDTEKALLRDKETAREKEKEKEEEDQKQNKKPLFPKQRSAFKRLHKRLSYHFPTFFTALPRLPFALVPFAFSQFILIEALAHQGWIDVFALWLVRASHRAIHPTVWLIGILGVVLCNLAGTNIGCTILLTKVVRAAVNSSDGFPDDSTRAAGIALVVASNIGAVSFTFSASLAGLLWKGILTQKGIPITQRTFAFWNMLPIFVMTAVGLGVVSAEMAVLYR